VAIRVLKIYRNLSLGLLRFARNDEMRHSIQMRRVAKSKISSFDISPVAWYLIEGVLVSEKLIF
jgi:hypothetical protein